MHARTTELLQHLDGTRQQLAAAYEAVPVERRDVRPSPERWSAGDVLSHLAMIEESVAGILQRRLRRALANELPPANDGPRVWRELADMLLDQELKVDAPDFVVPDGSRTAAQAWDSLTRSRPKLKQVLLAADGMCTESITAPHVVLGVMTFEQWFGFVGFHEQRHSIQIEALPR